MSGGVEVEDVAIPVDRIAPHRILVRIYRCSSGPLPVVVYLPALTGDASADGLARRLAARLTAAVVLLETARDLSQSATLDHGTALLGWLGAQGERRSLDGANVVVFGEGLGAATARLLMSHRAGPGWPVVSSPPILRPGEASAAWGSDTRAELRLAPIVSALAAALVQGKPQGISG